MSDRIPLQFRLLSAAAMAGSKFGALTDDDEPSLPVERKMEWEAERRFLNGQRQQIECRIAELDEILREFWPEKRPAA